MYAQYEDRGFVVVVDTYITDQDGTGIVHQAPAFGEDDHRIAREQGIVAADEMPPCPLDDVGRFVKPVTDYQGMHIKASQRTIVCSFRPTDAPSRWQTRRSSST